MGVSLFEPFILLRIPFIFVVALLSNFYITQIQQKEEAIDSLERDSRLHLEGAKRTLAAMYKISVVVPTLNMHKVLNIIVDSACEALECEIASICCTMNAPIRCGFSRHGEAMRSWFAPPT